jgi:hypothetical protein
MIWLRALSIQSAADLQLISQLGIDHDTVQPHCRFFIHRRRRLGFAHAQLCQQKKQIFRFAGWHGAAAFADISSTTDTSHSYSAFDRGNQHCLMM